MSGSTKCNLDLLSLVSAITNTLVIDYNNHNKHPILILSQADILFAFRRWRVRQNFMGCCVPKECNPREQQWGAEARRPEGRGSYWEDALLGWSPLSGTGLLNLTVSSFQTLSNYIPGDLSRRRKEKDFHFSPYFFSVVRDCCRAHHSPAGLSTCGPWAGPPLPLTPQHHEKRPRQWMHLTQP